MQTGKRPSTPSLLPGWASLRQWGYPILRKREKEWRWVLMTLRLCREVSREKHMKGKRGRGKNLRPPQTGAAHTVAEERA